MPKRARLFVLGLLGVAGAVGLGVWWRAPVPVAALVARLDPAAIAELGERGPAALEAVPPLMGLFTQPIDVLEAHAALEALDRICPAWTDSPAAGEIVRRLLPLAVEHGGPDRQWWPHNPFRHSRRVLNVLARRLAATSPGALVRLAEGLADDREDVRRVAGEALGDAKKSGSPGVIDAVIRAHTLPILLRHYEKSAVPTWVPDLLESVANWPDSDAARDAIRRLSARAETDPESARALAWFGRSGRAAVPALLRSLKGGDPDAAALLKRIDPDWPRSDTALEACRLEASPAALARLARAAGPGRLSRLAIEQLVPRLTDPKVTGEVEIALDRIDRDWPKSSEARRALRRFVTQLADPDDAVRSAAGKYVWWICPTASAQAGLGADAAHAVPELLTVLNAGDPAVRQRAAQALARIGPAASAALPSLNKCAGDPDRGTRLAAVRAVADIRPLSRDSVAILVAHLNGTDPELAVAALEALGHVRPGRGRQPAVAALRAILADTSVGPGLGLVAGGAPMSAASVSRQARQEHAARALGEIGPDAAAALPDLVARLFRGVSRDFLALDRIDPKWPASGPAQILTRPALERLGRWKSDADGRAAVSELSLVPPATLAAVVRLSADLDGDDPAVQMAAIGVIDRLHHLRHLEGIRDTRAILSQRLSSLANRAPDAAVRQAATSANRRLGGLVWSR